MKFTLVILAVAFAGAQAQEVFPRPCRTPEQYGGVVTNFRPADFLKVWYEIER